MNRSMTDSLMLVIPLKVTKRYDMNPPLASWIDNSKELKVKSHECHQDLLRLSSVRNCISSSICAHYAHQNAITENVMRDSMEYHAILMECENLGFPTQDDLGKTDLKISWDCAFQRNGQVRYCLFFLFIDGYRFELITLIPKTHLAFFERLVTI